MDRGGIKYFDQVPPEMDFAFASKSNMKAREYRQTGNKLYSKHHFKMALMEFNQSICWAEVGSEDLAIAYANRSAVFYEMGEYEFALANIGLAKEHNYPQRLLPKLLNRELNCEAKIASGFSAQKNPNAALMMRVDTNPRIPFLAKGIRMGRLPGYRRSMIVEQKYEVGDVLLHEKATVTCLSPTLRYSNCSYCGSENLHSLIPCPKCVSAMYCGKECLQNDQKLIHRFECGFSDNTICNMQGPRMFFYGFALFGENLEAMMEFCNTQRNTTVTADGPLCLDYTNYDALEGFKLIHNVDTINDERSSPVLRYCMNTSCDFYLSHPYVKSIFDTPARREILLQCFEKYQKITDSLSFSITNYTPEDLICSHFFPIASICNHSCNPNTAALYASGQIKLVARRPIAKGEPILISYGFSVDPIILIDITHFTCLCDFCAHNDHVDKWNVLISDRHKDKLTRILKSDRVNLAAKVNALQQFIQLYSHVHPDILFTYLQDSYQYMLNVMFSDDIRNMCRAKAVA